MVSRTFHRMSVSKSGCIKAVALICILVSASLVIPVVSQQISRSQIDTDDDIVEVNIPNGVPLVYRFDKDFNVISKGYLTEQGIQA